MGQEDVDFNNRINNISCKLQQLSWSPLATRGGLATGDAFTEDCGNQLNLLLQAQALLAKNILYQKIDAALQRLVCCAPHVYIALARGVPAAFPAADEEAVANGTQRDAIVTNLRFLNIFFNYRHDTFAHAVHLFDSVLSRVQVHPKFLSSIATSCLYIAAKANEPVEPNPLELLALGQPGGSLQNLLYTERVILELLGVAAADPSSIATPLTFLRLFHDIVSMECGVAGSAGAEERRHAKEASLAALVNNIEVLQSQFEFTRFRADVLALALLAHHVQTVPSDTVINNSLLLPIAELQYYCQINSLELSECRDMVAGYLTQYGRQPSKLPRLRLSWSISRRTLHKMKPSTRAAQDLEPIMEDDVIGQPAGGYRCRSDEDDDDSSPFDSEMEDSSAACKESDVLNICDDATDSD